MVELAAEGEHRRAVGGLWDEMGALVVGYLIDQGLERGHRVLDVGCGSLRIGVPLVEYLDPANYYGIDAVGGLIDAGYDRELAAAGLQHKLPRDHLLADDDFGVEALVGRDTVDVALAQSVFTHLPIGYLRRCLERLSPVVVGGGTFYATFFVVATGKASGPYTHRPGGIVTHPDRNPYHTTWDEIAAAAADQPWDLRGPDDFGHPRGQVMVQFVRRSGG